MSHRLFFGLRPPAQIRETLIAMMTDIDKARWQDDAQLHLTLRYIGEVDAHVADDIAEAAAAERFSPFDLEIAGLGTFERKGFSSAIWAGIAQSEPLERLQHRLERLCQKCGLPAETRRFTPHITLARLNQSSGSVGPFLTLHSRLSLKPWTVEEFHLFESTLRPAGSVYDAVVSYRARG